MASSVDMTGQMVGNWKVLRKARKIELDETKKNIKGTYWLCQCQCEKKTLRFILGKSLRSGLSNSCGCMIQSNSLIDITGEKFGEWKVLHRATEQELNELGPLVVSSKAYWLCECSCEDATRRVISGTDLRNGKTRSCGHATTGFKDYTGKQIGNWNIIRRVNKLELEKNGILDGISKTYWLCECTCGSGIQQIMNSATLKRKPGCKECLTDAREKVQEALKKASKNCSSVIEEIINRLGLEEHEYVLNDTSILDGETVDIAIPAFGIAIDYNNESRINSVSNNKRYWFEKKQKVEKAGYRLVHIHEHEYLDSRKKELIYGMLSSIIHGSDTVYARKCEVKQLYSYEERQFNETYHLQGHVASSICYGLFYNRELIALMSFGVSRFDKNGGWELLRYTVRPDITALGGAEKLFKAFTRENNNASVISYCDLAKFTGAVYGRLGLKLDTISEPNYVWWKKENGVSEALTRYRCQKHKLVAKGWGTVDQTENQIMENMGYTKVYDCGNAKYVLK